MGNIAAHRWVLRGCPQNTTDWGEIRKNGVFFDDWEVDMQSLWEGHRPRATRVSRLEE